MDLMGLVISLFQNKSRYNLKNLAFLELPEAFASLWTKQYYELLEWRSDKSHNGIHLISNTFPDLHFRRTNTKETRSEFAIE